MNLAIFGGSGFIGTRLVKRLLLRSNIFIKIFDKIESRDHPEIYKYLDVRESESICNALSFENIDVIINLAAEHRDDVTPASLYDEVNINGAKNIVDAANIHNINKIIFTSSVAIYGFAPIGTDENGKVAPFNEYGRTKYEAEKIYINWQQQRKDERTLVIIRPTVVFGEQNRGNVYNLLKQISSGKFIMIGNGENRKSLAYVENIAAFIEHSIDFESGIHIYNYTDKPDFTMNQLVDKIRRILGRNNEFKLRIPYAFGLCIGHAFDLVSKISTKKLSISAIRIKKFCANSVYDTSVDKSGFIAPVSLERALENTMKYEFIDKKINM